MATRIARCAVAVAAALSLIGPAAHASVPRPVPTDFGLGADSGLDQQDAGSSGGSGTELDGIFELAAGQCTNSGGVTSGSYFRMIQPRGDAKNGPFITNSNSSCGDDTYTPMESGEDGGLATGAYQPNPEPAFDGAGNAQARGIFKPLNFQGIAYGGSTNEVDPQTRKDVDAPAFAVTSDGKLTGNVESVSVAWNNQHFNQGAPKPDGSTPGLTQVPHGTFDTATNAFEMEWTSTISGGPFDGFTGLWHLEGTFAPNARPSTPSSSGSNDVSAQSTDGSNGDVAAAGVSGGGGSSSLGSAAAKSAKTLPNTGPGVPPWLAWLFTFNGFAFGLAWLGLAMLRARRSLSRLR